MQIHRSAARGDLDAVRGYLDRGVPCDVRDIDPWNSAGSTALMCAAASPHADVAVVELLLARGANPNAIGGRVDTFPLYLAAQGGRVDKVGALLAAGADIRLANHHGYTALIGAAHATATSLLEIVEVLAAAGADLDAASSYRESAVRVCSRRARFDVVARLVERGANPAPLEWSPLMRAIAIGDVGDFAARLDPAVLDERDSWERTPWLLALATGDVEKARALHRAGAETDVRGRCGRRPLMYPAQGDHGELLDWVLSLGFAVDATDELGTTALMEAAQDGAARCVRRLLDAGADVHAVDRHDSQALHHASTIEVAEMLVAAGADIDRVDGSGYSPLRSAAEREDLAMVRGLLKRGARPDLAGISESALYSAVRADALEIVRRLLEAGADPNHVDIDDWSPLTGVRSLEVADLLLRAGARVRSEDLEQQKDPELRARLARG